MTRRMLAFLFALEVAGFAFLIFALFDRRAHQAESPHRVNQWGFRGGARGERQPRELRVALVGGSAAYEIASDEGDTLAVQMLYELQVVGNQTEQEFSVVNLAEPRIGADSYAGILRSYAFLEPDIVCIFDGYDALTGVPPHSRQRSVVFRFAGYLPILPARILGRRPWLSDVDGSTLEILQDGRTEPSGVGCDGASKTYCAHMAETVRFALQRGRPTIVASPPFVSSRHAAQQRSLGVALTQEFGSDPRFMYLDLGSTINLGNRTESPDGIHRTALGNHEVGLHIAVGIRRLLERLHPSSIRAQADGSR